MALNMLLKSTASTLVVYFQSGDNDHMVGSFPKTKLGMLNAAIALVSTGGYFAIVPNAVQLDLGAADAIVLVEAMKDGSYLMTHLRDHRNALAGALNALIAAATGK